MERLARVHLARQAVEGEKLLSVKYGYDLSGAAAAAAAAASSSNFLFLPSVETRTRYRNHEHAYLYRRKNAFMKFSGMIRSREDEANKEIRAG